MTDKDRIEEKKVQYRKFADRTGAVGRMPATKRPNSGRDHEPEKVLEIFRASHDLHKPVQDKAIGNFGEAKPKKS